jgi:hypothetical protein
LLSPGGLALTRVDIFRQVIVCLVAEEIVMDAIFDWCVAVLVYWANLLGITYKEINVWVFVILWPVFTLLLLGIILWQQRKIRTLSRRK